MIIFKTNKQRMLVYPYLPGRDVDPQELLSEQETNTWTGGRSNQEYNTLQSMTRFVKQDSKYDTEFLSSNDALDDYIRSKALKHVVSGPESILPSLKGFNLAVEVASHFRPLLYVLLIRKYGKTSWIPWITSLVVDGGCYYSRTLTPDSSTLVKNEKNRRFFLLMLYLVRSPFYQKYTKQYIDSIQTSWHNKPLVGMVSTLIQDYQPLWENVFYYINLN